MLTKRERKAPDIGEGVCARPSRQEAHPPTTADLPGLEKSFRSAAWSWGSGRTDFVERNSQPSAWLPWPVTSFYSLGSCSPCPPLQTLLHRIPKAEAVFHSLLRCRDWQEKEALGHSDWLLPSCSVWQDRPSPSQGLPGYQ